MRTAPSVPPTRPSLVVRLACFTAAASLLAAACGSSADDDAVDASAAEEVTTTDDGSTDESDAVDDETTSAAGDGSTVAGVDAAQWSSGVTVTVGDGEWRFESDGIPDHELPDQFLVPQEGSFTPPVEASEVSAVDRSVAVVASPIDQTITLNPVLADEPTDTPLGIIGVAISGAQLFNDYEDQDRAFVAVDDNFSIDGVFFVDSCNGHPLALAADGTGSGDYHYHGVPYCITDAIDTDGEHSRILGFLLDGFPFYGPQDVDGAIITSDDLDECSGHVGPTPEFPDGIYHYHLTEDRSPYTVDCFRGEVEVAANQGPPPRG